MESIKCPYCGATTDQAVCPRCRAAIPHNDAKVEDKPIKEPKSQPTKTRKTK